MIEGRLWKMGRKTLWRTPGMQSPCGRQVNLEDAVNDVSKSLELDPGLSESKRLLEFVRKEIRGSARSTE